LQALDALAAGTAVAEIQDDNQSCYAAKLQKDEALLDWQLPAEVLARKVRAFNPYPVVFTRLKDSDERIRVWEAQAIVDSSSQPAGSVVEISPTGIRVSCGQGS